MVVTGVLLFYAIPVRNYQNIFFRIKMVMLVLAGLNVWIFHNRIERRLPTGTLIAVPPRARPRRRRSRRSSSGLRIIVAGRMIAYNWFDCDIQPQPAFINWAAGCVVPAEVAKAGAADMNDRCRFFQWCEASWIGNVDPPVAVAVSGDRGGAPARPVRAGRRGAGGRPAAARRRVCAQPIAQLARDDAAVAGRQPGGDAR